MLPHIRSNTNWTVVVNGKTYTFNKSHLGYEKLCSAVMDGDIDTFLGNITAKKAISSWSDERFKLSGEDIFFNDEKIEPVLARYTLNMIKDGFNCAPLFKFIDNLYKNPSARSVEQLFKFLEHGGFPITEDGCFLAYKAVRPNYTDKYSGKISNKIGAVAKMRRNQVMDDPMHHCHRGLHAGTHEYASGYASPGDLLIVVKVNPKNVVSVPNDGNQKLRCCEYKVVSLCEGQMSDSVQKSSKNRLTSEKGVA